MIFWKPRAAGSPTLPGSDGPLATFGIRARTSWSSLFQKPGFTQIDVQFRGGTYYLPSTRG